MKALGIAGFITIVALTACGGATPLTPRTTLSSAKTPKPSPSPSPTVAPSPTATASPSLVLSWSDEFNGGDGAAVDTTKWTDDAGATVPSYNNELEYYTNATDPSAPNYTTANAHQDGLGNLVIQANQEAVPYDVCWYGACQYTSARLKTLGLFSQQYGRFEARIKIPKGQGLWPAFWMMGADGSAWPSCGEIDVMENIGSRPAVLVGSAHGPNYTGSAISSTYTLPPGNLSDDYHVYAIQWKQGEIDYYIDNTLYETITPASMPLNGIWEFDKPFYILINLAVGGNWPGSPDATTVFPAQMLIDYVRVYQ